MNTEHDPARNARAGGEPPIAGATDAGRPGETTAEQAQFDERMLLALRAAEDKKGLDIVALDLRPVASFTDFFFITSGTNARQVQAIADEIEMRLKRHGGGVRIEGYQTAEWVLLDYGDFVFHVFEAKARSFYDLERLWRDARRVPVTPEMLRDPSAGSAGDAAGADGAGENA